MFYDFPGQAMILINFSALAMLNAFLAVAAVLARCLMLVLIV